jgi:Fic family protein
MPYEPFPAFSDWEPEFDGAAVSSAAARLSQARAASTDEDRRRALEVATRYAAVDTGALEGLYTTDRGFTKTVATQSEHWVRALDLKGERAKRSIEDALAAYEYVLDAVTGRVPITQVWLRELHALITKHQDSHDVWVPVADGGHWERRPLPHGEYKQSPNNPTSTSTGREHHYAPPEDTHAEMTRLVDELNSPGFAQANSVVQAAYVHYAYVAVHPFADGNGRVARALASVYLYRKPGVPLVVFADQRDLYIDALEAADLGQPDRFVQFIADRVVDTVGLVAQSLASSRKPDLDALAQVLAGQPEFDSIGAVAERVAHVCSARLEDAARALGLPDELGLEISCSTPNPQDFAPPPHQDRVRSQVIGLSAYLKRGVHAVKSLGHRTFTVGVNEAETQEPDIVVFDEAELGRPPLEVWRREIDPVETTAFRLKAEAWAANEIARLISDLSSALRSEDRHRDGEGGEVDG